MPVHVGMPEHAAKDADCFSAKDADGFSAQDADDFSVQDADGFSAKYADDSSAKDADDFSAQDAGDSSAGAGVLPGAPAAHGRQSALHSGPTAETKVKQRTNRADKGADIDCVNK